MHKICNFIDWFIAPENIYANIVTIISVILSGLVSWILSARYFDKGNRNSLNASVLHPIKLLINESPSWQGYRSLLEYQSNYSMKYIKPKERKVFDELLLTYKEICQYKYENVCAESLNSYFQYKLKMHGIDPTPVPVMIEDEVVEYEIPSEMGSFKYDLERVIKEYPPEYYEEECKESVLHLFERYCKECYSNSKIPFFDDYSFSEVLSKAKNKNDWDHKLDQYENAKKKFLDEIKE